MIEIIAEKKIGDEFEIVDDEKKILINKNFIRKFQYIFSKK